jgi:ComF family protein
MLTPATRASLAAVGRALLDLALPRACVVCQALASGRDEGPACGRCWSRVRALPHPQCERCGHPRGERDCRWCAQLPPWVRAARSVAWVDHGSALALVHALKYEGWGAVAEGMAARMARLAWPRDVVEERAAVVAVPLAPARERERGFNQSALIARALAARWGVRDAPHLLERTRATRSQTRLTPGERRSNVSGAFRAAPAATRELRGAHIVLVDDVLTTGATVVECANALLAGGARIVSVVTFGRAPALGDRRPDRSERDPWQFA